MYEDMLGKSLADSMKKLFIPLLSFTISLIAISKARMITLFLQCIFLNFYTLSPTYN